MIDKKDLLELKHNHIFMRVVEQIAKERPNIPNSYSCDEREWIQKSGEQKGFDYCLMLFGIKSDES